ncbi:unnamed protein product [Staurois parvus]|uniref:Uncharacterized protein n=1 Tax=Staurois parvus TaxID=386267 RepID=A0ABN9FRQ1_9NEOB|nr:unnamed protein product [Staurois parvus]
MCTVHQGTDDLYSPSCQCLLVHINATYQCPSEQPFSASQCCLSMPISATYQCLLISAA